MCKVALFTDTLDEMNGVSRFIRDMGRLAHESGRSLTIVTSSAKVRHELPYRVNFPPLLSTKLPYYPDVPAVLPPKGKIRKWLEENRPDAIEISTPGVLGMMAFSIAKKMKIPVLGVYHTDFPAFVRDITGNRLLAGMTTAFMERFYGRMDAVFSRTTQYFPKLKDLGLPEDRLLLTLPFVDLNRFRPDFRNEGLWEKLGVSEKHKLLFCGRVSKEKSMPMLVDIFGKVSAMREDTALIIAGFGPYLEEFKKRLEGKRVYYLGLLSDRELAELYASSDLYVFPSLTDTLGQVVLESQACGTPVLVSDRGGPKEVVDDGKTGMVLPGKDLEAWVRAINGLLDDPARLAAMRVAAWEYVQRFDQKAAFEDFWRYFETAAKAGGRVG